MENNNSAIFIFGSKIFEEKRRDAISSLPLEMSWLIFSYLDDLSLRNATKVDSTWRRIILSNKALKKRLNIFETALMLGSRGLIKYSGRNKKRLHKKRNEYLLVGKCVVEATKNGFKRKRGASNFTVYTKRYKLNTYNS